MMTNAFPRRRVVEPARDHGPHGVQWAAATKEVPEQTLGTGGQSPTDAIRSSIGFVSHFTRLPGE